MPQLAAGETQIFARIPTDLYTEIRDLAKRNYRPLKGELCSAMERFIKTDTPDLDRHWRFEKGEAADVTPVNPIVSEQLGEDFRRSAARVQGGLGMALAHAIELHLAAENKTRPPAKRRRAVSA